MKQQILEAKLQRIEAILAEALTKPNPKADLVEALKIIRRD